MQAVLGIIAFTLALAIITFGGATIIIELNKEPPPTLMELNQ